MRNRMIKATFWEDDRLAEISAYARLLFIALWNLADDEGYLENRPKWIKAKCFPYDDVDINKLLQELKSIEVIVENNEILWIRNFSKHQIINRPIHSNLKKIFSEPSVSIHDNDVSVHDNDMNTHGVISEHSHNKRERKEKDKDKENIKDNCKDNIVGASAADFEDLEDSADIPDTESPHNPQNQSLTSQNAEPAESPPTTTPSISQKAEQIVQSWNKYCQNYPQLSQVLSLSDKRRQKLKVRIREPSFDFEAILAAIDRQPFLMGENKQGWSVSFDWLIENSNNYLKVLEMIYSNTNNSASNLENFVKSKYAEYEQQEIEEDSNG